MPFSERPQTYLFEESGSVRLDAWLAQFLADTSRAKVQKLIEQGKIRVNEKVVKRSYLLKSGDRVDVLWEPDVHVSCLKPAPLGLSILFEDEDILVFDKASGISVHPGAGERHTTVVEGILHRLGREVANHQGLRPGLVHRLDKDTTGVMVYAKNERAQLQLAKQFATRQIEREYVALLDGYLKEKHITYESYLSRDLTHRQRFASLTATEFENRFGKPVEKAPRSFRRAVSIFTLKKTYGHRLSLASVRLQTGRTHQIRVHSKALNCPVLGDPLYNRPREFPAVFAPDLRKALMAVPRQMLHAQVLGFRHPRSNEDMTFEAPLPRDFEEILKQVEPYRDTP